MCGKTWALDDKVVRFFEVNKIMRINYFGYSSYKFYSILGRVLQANFFPKKTSAQICVRCVGWVAEKKILQVLVANLIKTQIFVQQ